MSVERPARPVFLITVDTEGDNLWSRPRRVTTHNARFLPRFQSLCERYGFRPTYLVNYEMAGDQVCAEFARDVARRGAGEIGMHLHAWNTPPLIPLTSDDFRYQPYLMEYPADLIREKVRVMTDHLFTHTDVRAVSHRAGRWGLNETYARALVEHGYVVDCTVTPSVSWRDHRGDPDGRGGPDYSAFPRVPYFIDLRNIARPGRSSLLEIPMTLVPSPRARFSNFRPLVTRLPRGRRASDRLWPATHWFRPNGRNGQVLGWIVQDALSQKRTHLQMMVHSSELMPGGSPRFRTRGDVEILYRDLEGLFAVAAGRFAAATLREFHDAWKRENVPPTVAFSNERT